MWLDALANVHLDKPSVHTEDYFEHYQSQNLIALLCVCPGQSGTTFRVYPYIYLFWLVEHNSKLHYRGYVRNHNTFTYLSEGRGI